MFEVCLETIIDSLKILPFLFFAFILIEYMEHKIDNEKIIKKFSKTGPIIGSILGLVPQCGFSVFATNLYITRIISLGTLIAVYLSTSDEMLVVLMAHGENIKLILQILAIKLVIGIAFGFIIDILFKKKLSKGNFNFCQNEHCNCQKGILNSSLKHTFKTFIFIFIITLALNTLFYIIGDNALKNLFNNNWYTPFIASLIGLIPNCAASITLTEIYLNGVISMGSAIAGLLTSSGASLLILFKTNKNLKENIFIVSLLYIIGVISGLIINILF